MPSLPDVSDVFGFTSAKNETHTISGPVAAAGLGIGASGISGAFGICATTVPPTRNLKAVEGQRHVNC